jgi:hypothetical protein
MDAGIVSGSPTRIKGQPPTAEEQLDLYCCLYHRDKDVNWKQELANVQRGEGLSQKARECCGEHNGRHAERLARGNPGRGR